MVRDWTFTLPLVGTVYNLWKDLISQDPTFTSPTFSNAPYVPNCVCELKFQNLTPGANITRNSNGSVNGFNLTGGSWDVDRSDNNDIDLTKTYFITDTAGAQIYVKITAN